jgi:Protein of unknown function (DUF2637)
MTDRLIRITTALAVATVAAVAAVISYRHAYELVSTHGETGVTARLLPFTVDGLILAASMLILDANRRGRTAPPLARWCLGAGIVATIGANLAHGLGHGPIGALVSAWPALALAGSFELLMTLIRPESQPSEAPVVSAALRDPAPVIEQEVPPALTGPPSLEQAIRTWHNAGHSQRAKLANSTSTAEKSNACSKSLDSRDQSRVALAGKVPARYAMTPQELPLG